VFAVHDTLVDTEVVVFEIKVADVAADLKRIMKIQTRIQWLVLAQTKFLQIMQILTIILATLTLCVK
jgi:hypothetical protein